MTTIISVANERELRRFINFPHTLYRGDKNYTPELYITQKELFDKKKNPFYKHSKVELLLAVKNGMTVGRIAVFRDDKFIRHSGKMECFFGFFECINDFRVAEHLLDGAMRLAKKEGLSVISGPFNYTIHDSCGLLINGFDKPAVIAMPYNKPYYQDFMNKYGFSKKIDMYAYEISTEHTPQKLTRHRNIFEERLARQGVVVRSINMKNFESEVKKLHVAYNSAFKDNWGFVPLSFEEFSYKARGIKAVAEAELLLMAEKQEEVVGFMITLPDINQILRKIQNGKLFPFGLLKLLYYKNKVDSCRISVAGVIDKFRNSGIEAVLYAREYETARKKGFKTAEASYVMENNTVMKNLVENIGAHKTKEYRIYEIMVAF